MGAPQRDQWRIGPKCLSAVNSGRFIDPGRERVDGRIPQDLRKKPSRHDYRFAPPRGRSPPTASDDCSKRWEKKRVLGIKFNRVVSKRVCHESRQLSSFAQVVRLRQFRYVSRFRLVVHMSGDQDLRIALLGSWREQPFPPLKPDLERKTGFPGTSGNNTEVSCFPLAPPSDLIWSPADILRRQKARQAPVANAACLVGGRSSGFRPPRGGRCCPSTRLARPSPWQFFVRSLSVPPSAASCPAGVCAP